MLLQAGRAGLKNDSTTILVNVINKIRDLGVRNLQACHLPLAALSQSTACTRATNTALPALSSLNIEASPSFTSNQSLPKASIIFGLCVTISVFFPTSGI